MIDLLACLQYLRPGCVADCVGDDLSLTTWKDPRPMPTQAEVDAAWVQVQAQRAAVVNNEGSLRSQADAALADLRTYCDLASPTNAQTTAAVKLLCRVAIGLIRLHLRKFDATS